MRTEKQVRPPWLLDPMSSTHNESRFGGLPDVWCSEAHSRPCQLILGGVGRFAGLLAGVDGARNGLPARPDVGCSGCAPPGAYNRAIGANVKILITFTGFHDPYAKGLVGEVDQPGPILSLLRARIFDLVYLLSTPNTERNTSATVATLKKQVELRLIEVPLQDPTDYGAILKHLRSILPSVVEEFAGAEYFISVASGTPQMHACWVLLAASGEFPARILQIRPPRYVTAERDLVSEIDFMGQSPWAMALEPLVTLAKLSNSPIGGATVEAAALAYSADGYRCDGAALDALSRFRETTSDAVIMKRATRALYEPWLDASARHFQNLVRKAGKVASPPVTGERDVCVLFVDGLRFDVGAGLAVELEQRGLIVKLGHRLSTLPTVTATAKPAVMKISGELHGGAGEDFAPFLGIKVATAPVMRNAMAQTGVEILEGSETLFPSGSDGGGWAEFGQIDAYGHAHPDDLPVRVRTEVMNAADRILQLLGAGWRKVRVVTDHGWLLMPEGLPKVELPAYLAATKWSRCAVVKGDAAVPSYPWHWNADVRIASPPGIACFRAGEKYSHGGVSLQECVVPEIVVEQGVEAVRVSIVSVDWRGMRCRVKVDSNDPSVLVDIRTNWKQSGSTIVAAAKAVGSSGEVSLVVDDRHEGAGAVVVIIDSGGTVLSQKTTSVGEKS